MPRKSTASTSAAPTSPTTAQAGDTSTLSNATEPKSPTTKSSKRKDDDSVGIDNLLLPRSLTSRISRGILPPNTSLQKDAILALTKSATVFISYLASTANELTSRKTISPQDVMKALHEVELDGVMEIGKTGKDGRQGGRLERELEVFESVVRGKRKGYREKVKARESGVSGVDGDEGDEERGEPEKKRVRRTSDDNPEDEEDLLDAQLNGATDGTVSDFGVAGGSFGAAGAKVDEREPDYGVVSGSFGASAIEEGNDDTEDDPEIEDEEDEDAPEDEEDEQEQKDEDEDRIDVDEGGGRSRLMLAPNGRAEVGSEDESD